MFSAGSNSWHCSSENDASVPPLLFYSPDKEEIEAAKSERVTKAHRSILTELQKSAAAFFHLSFLFSLFANGYRE